MWQTVLKYEKADLFDDSGVGIGLRLFPEG